MWFEILPAAGAVFGCMTFGYYAVNVVPYLFWGKRYSKHLTTNAGVQTWFRDERLTGYAYQIQGLEAIPLEGEELKSASKKK